MSFFEYVSVLSSIIIGLGVTYLLAGVGRLIARPGEVRIYWVHLLWVAYQFLAMIFVWWFEFSMRQIQTWRFPTYVFLTIYLAIAYLQCVVLLPEDQPRLGFRRYYYDRRKLIFGLWILGLLMDFGDTAMKGREHFLSLGLEYPIRAVAQIGLFALAAYWPNERFHGGLAVASLIYVTSWALRVFPEFG